MRSLPRQEGEGVASAEPRRPLVGRESELAEIDRCTFMGVGTLLVGATGAGKTSLLNAALEQAERSGARVLRAEQLPGMGHPPAHQPYRRTVIGIDDVQLADEVTFGLAHRLVQSGRAMLLATAELGAGLPAGMRRLLVGRRMRRLTVEPLDRSGVVRILRARLGGPVTVDTAERLWQLTLGNPLMLRELVDQSLTDGTLNLAGGRWRWSGLHGEPGGRLVDLADLLLGDLDPDERELVNTLALAGRLEAGSPLVTALGDAAESLNRRGVVVARRSGIRLVLRLAHPLCEAVVAASLPELTTRRLRPAIAEAIEGKGTGLRRRDDILRAVRIRAFDGPLPDPAGLRDAAVAALHVQDYPLAERLCRSVPGGGADEVLATTMLGEALAGQGRHIEAEAHFAAAPQSGWLVRERVLNMALGLGRLAEAEAVAGTDRELRALVRLFKGRIGEARELAREASGASTLLALLLHLSGDGEGALAVLDTRGQELRSSGQETLGPYERVRGQAALVDHHFLAGWIASETRGPAAAGEALSALRELAVDGGLRAGAYAGLLEAHILRGTGRNVAAISLLRQAAAWRGTGEWLTSQSWRIAQLASAVAESGDTSEAEALLDEARAAQRLAATHPAPAEAIALESALVKAHLGDLAGAASQALETAANARAAGRRMQELAAVHLAARLGAASDAAASSAEARFVAASEKDTAELTGIRLEHVRALAQHDGAGLDDVSRRFAALGMAPLAAEAAEQAAQAHHTSGDRRSTKASRAAGVKLAAGCDTTINRWDAQEDPGEPRTRTRAELTVREREIATLAVSHLSNQEIADRLVLSVRTVENHLYRAYGKLGVTTRAELAPRLGVGSAQYRRTA